MGGPLDILLSKGANVSASTELSWADQILDRYFWVLVSTEGMVHSGNDPQTLLWSLCEEASFLPILW